jgi:DNA-binding PadR family transcriptional regulator
MSLEYAILGFLNYAPLTGYELKKAFDASVRHFWPANQSQIYRTLARMAERGWVEMEVVPQEDRPPRKVYHITEAGREALLRWLSTPPALTEPRIPWLIHIAAPLPDEHIAAMLKALLEQVQARLEALSRVPEAIRVYSALVGSARDAWLWALALEYGRTML